MSSESTDIDLINLRAAQGWIELGNDKEAEAEFGKVPMSTRWKENRLFTFCLLLTHRKRWLPCLYLAEQMVKEFPKSVSGHVFRSRALDGMNKTQEAIDVLGAAMKHFPEYPGIAYEVARCFHRLGGLKAARYWVGQCLQYAKQAKDLDYYKRLIAEDEALQPLFEDIPDQETINAVSLN